MDNTKHGTNLAEVGTDCISRQAAFDALDKRFDSIPMEQTTEILLLRKDLRELPPAHPEPDIDDVKCDNCRYSERYVDGLILCRRTKTSHRVSATSTCGKGKREVEDAEAKV